MAEPHSISKQDNYLTDLNGAPIPNDTNTITAVGERGPVLLMDAHFINKMAAFNRAPVPPRPVHARGSGAYGTFKVTGDITKYSKAKLFSSIGKETEVFVRFSGSIGDSGSSDTIREIKGFAIKFYTEEGNWDLAANHFPVFFVRDTIKFPDSLRAQMRDTRHFARNPSLKWDFFSLHPESLHIITMLFTDRGTPMSFRHMHGFGANTFSFLNSDNERFYCKFHLITQQGIKNFNRAQAALIAGQEPDFQNQDLYEAIEEKNFPKWKLYVQILPEQQASYPFAFDATKVWPHKEFPLIEVGELELNRNPTNYHAEVEQSAFSPANIVPGISLSPDRLLQGRLFAYADAQRYRIGVNFPMLPVNCPHAAAFHTNQYGGTMYPVVDDKYPGYAPSNIPESLKENTVYEEPPFPIPPPAAPLSSIIETTTDSDSVTSPVVSSSSKTTTCPSSSASESSAIGNCSRFTLGYDDEELDFFLQPRLLFELLPPEEKKSLADNLGDSLETVPQHIADTMLGYFTRIHPDYGKLVEEALNARKEKKAERSEAEWVLSASLQILKNKEEPDDMVPKESLASTPNDWPNKYKEFIPPSTEFVSPVHETQT